MTTFGAATSTIDAALRVEILWPTCESDRKCQWGRGSLCESPLADRRIFVLSKKMKAMCVVAVAAAFSFVGGPAFAAAQSELHKTPAVSAGANMPIETRVNVPFTSPQSLLDAIKVPVALGHPVLGYRFENNEIVGEFAVDGASSADEFVKTFEQRYGTQPQVVAAIVSLPVDEAKQRYMQRSSDGIAAVGDTFTAPPADPAKVEALFASQRATADAPSSARTAADPAHTWHPKSAELTVTNWAPSFVNFTQFYYWPGGNSQTQYQFADDGFEAEINIYTNHPNYQSGVRPRTCPVDYKDRPFAKNHDWTWEALINAGSGMGPVAASVGAYADYNDLGDDCNRNSIAIGFRNPQDLPNGPGGRQELAITITAPRGLDSAGKVSGLMQPVSEHTCVLVPWLALTDCMGATLPYDATPRYTLSTSWGWTGPNLCWRSDGYGLVDPTTFNC